MKCKICGNDTENDVLCDECREEINLLSDEMVSFKRKINLDFDEHHYMAT